MGSSTFPIFISVLCDNLLLTVVVPILPELLSITGNDFVANKTTSEDRISLNPYNQSYHNQTTIQHEFPRIAQDEHENTNGDATRDCLRRLLHLHMLHENSQLGLLFSTKALVQLFANPFVGSLTFKIGYKIPLCIGNFILMLCSLVFAFANSYGLFVVGRSFHGLASSLISVSGMALIAEAYPIDEQRTRFLGRVMGAAALGVLIGYPFGGITFSLFGKLIPFLSIAAIAIGNVVFQITQLQKYDIMKAFHSTTEEQTDLLNETNMMTMPTTIWSLFKDRFVKIISVAIWASTTAMAVLEPTLPVWLMENMNPPKWQLGLVFIPDSLGYFVGTNFFGGISLRVGRWKMSMISLAAVGISCFLLPMAKKVWQLTLPHFALGLGLGIIDASLMPLLARLADDKYHAGYGCVYALAQTSVALAYSLGPLAGGELVPVIGFPDLMGFIGFLNLLICPLMVVLSDAEGSGYNRVEHTLSLSSSEEDTDDRTCSNFNKQTNQATLQKLNSSESSSNGDNKRQQLPEESGLSKARLVELLPLKTYKSRYNATKSDTYNYTRFDDHLDSD